MKALHTYTLRCLKKNRLRTLVTIVGIMLSVALFSAVSEGAYSGQQYLINNVKASVGSYHAYYEGLSETQLQSLAENAELAQLAGVGTVGWAAVAPDNEAYPYLCIRSANNDLCDLLPIRVLEGRLPENETELLVPENLERSNGVKLSVGQTVELHVGQRFSKGTPMGENSPYLGEDEQLEMTQPQSYTIVGICARLPSSLEGYSMPGCAALTTGRQGSTYSAFFTLKNINATHDFISAHVFGENRAIENRNLLLCSGASGNRALVSVLYGLAAILFVLIMFGSIALIYNSFSISVSERTRQFGLLKSIGASNRQIRGSVLLEALYLCAAAIPLGLLVGCAGIGVTFYALRDEFSAFGFGSDVNVPIALVPNASALLAAAAIGLITALISAAIPARRAMRITPIDAIRRSKDLRLRRQNVKSSRLVERLFGFPGLLASKNFKRDRKKYRSTVVSLFLSVVLFLSASSFSLYLRQDVSQNINVNPFDLHVSYFPTQDDLTADALFAKLCQADAVTQAEPAEVCGIRFSANCQSVSEEANSVDDPESPFEGYAALFFVREEYYRTLCADAQVDPANGYALAYDLATMTELTERGARYHAFRLFSSFPVTIQLTKIHAPESYTLSDERYENGEHQYVFIKYDEDGFPVDQLILPAEEAEEQYLQTLSSRLDELPLVGASGSICLYLPISAKADFHDMDSGFEFFFNSSDHSRTKDSLHQTLESLGLDHRSSVWDTRSGEETDRAILLVLDVFTFGFIILISLIAAANVFNTISTNINLRRRELATLKSVGMSKRDFGRMLRFECLLYGTKALLYGLPVSALMSYLIYLVIGQGFASSFTIPWVSVGIAVLSVFAVVFVTMVYAMHKVNKENTVETLRNENI